MKKMLCLAFALVLTLASFSGCKGEKIVGKWYNEDGVCLEITSDHKFVMESELNAGTWQKAEKDSYTLIDNGDADTVTIEKNDLGEFLTYWDNIFYKDEYPSDMQ